MRLAIFVGFGKFIGSFVFEHGPLEHIMNIELYVRSLTGLLSKELVLVVPGKRLRIGALTFRVGNAD